jgi:hypothetical protein
MSIKIAYTNFKSGPPPSSTFDIPKTCKCV